MFEDKVEKCIGRTCVVTVTYGDRYPLLESVLEKVISVGVGYVIVVDNASCSKSADKLKCFSTVHKNQAFVVCLKENIGSAGGYKSGILKALETDYEFIWLLDDDNLPDCNTLCVLFQIYAREAGQQNTDALALSAFRPDHQPDIAIGLDPRRAFPRPGSFFGFHILDVPFKLWRRTPWGRPELPSHGIPEVVRIPWAPYGGLLFHRDVLERLGLPDEKFVMYGDDNEYTARFTRSGGTILLATRACIKDLEPSWHIKSRFCNSFKGWMLGGDDLRAYYSARNQAYFDRVLWGYASRWLRINMVAYLAGLLLYAILLRRLDRLHLFIKAVRDGMQGKLGLSESYHLE